MTQMPWLMQYTLETVIINKPRFAMYFLFRNAYEPMTESDKTKFSSLLFRKLENSFTELSAIAASYYRLADQAQDSKLLYNMVKNIWLEIITLIETHQLTERLKDLVFSLTKNLGSISIKLREDDSARMYFEKALTYAANDGQRGDIEKRLTPLSTVSSAPGF